MFSMKFALMAIAAWYTFLVKQTSAEIVNAIQSVFPEEKLNASMFLNSDTLTWFSVSQVQFKGLKGNQSRLARVTTSSAPFTSHPGTPLSIPSSLPSSQTVIASQMNEATSYSPSDQLPTSTPTPTQHPVEWLGTSTAATEMVSSSKRMNGLLVMIVAMLAVVASIVIASKHFFARRSLGVFEKTRARARNSDHLEEGTIHGRCQSRSHAVSESGSQQVEAHQHFLQCNATNKTCHEVGTIPHFICFHEFHADTALDSESELSCCTSDSGSTGAGSSTRIPVLNQALTQNDEIPHQYYENSMESSKWKTSLSCYKFDDDGIDVSDRAVTVLETDGNRLLPLQLSIHSFPSQSLRQPVKDPLALGDTVLDFDDSSYPDRISV